MTIATQIIGKELERNERMIEEYANELLELPKGKLTLKKINSHCYYYLKYRDGKKVVTEYVGKDEGDLEELAVLLEKRKHIQEMIRQLKSERKILEKLGNMI